MVIIRTSAEDVSIHAVSPESILGVAASAGVAAVNAAASVAAKPIAKRFPLHFTLSPFRGRGRRFEDVRDIALLSSKFILFPFDWIF
jgi:hypothetical protein